MAKESITEKIKKKKINATDSYKEEIQKKAFLSLEENKLSENQDFLQKLIKEGILEKDNSNEKKDYLTAIIKEERPESIIEGRKIKYLSLRDQIGVMQELDLYEKREQNAKKSLAFKILYSVADLYNKNVRHKKKYSEKQRFEMQDSIISQMSSTLEKILEESKFEIDNVRGSAGRRLIETDKNFTRIKQVEKKLKEKSDLYQETARHHQSMKPSDPNYHIIKLAQRKLGFMIKDLNEEAKSIINQIGYDLSEEESLITVEKLLSIDYSICYNLSQKIKSVKDYISSTKGAWTILKEQGKISNQLHDSVQIIDNYISNMQSQLQEGISNRMTKDQDPSRFLFPSGNYGDGYNLSETVQMLHEKHHSHIAELRERFDSYSNKDSQ